MTRPLWTVRIFSLWAVYFLLAGGGACMARADGLDLTAIFGVAGHYRPGTWCPVTVTVHNPGLETLSGQAQVLAANDSNHSNYGGPGSNSALATALFARPISINGSGQQSFVVYARGIDPGRDTVTVQLTEGRERGDGRILAQTDNRPSNSAPTVTGNPIQPNDLFLVGFGGDPGAFTYLSGQKLGLAHGSSGGIVSDTPNSGINPNGIQGAPATAQVAEAGADDLPDKAAGYSGVDAVLLRSDAPLDTLTEAQTDALKGWVAAGGHLIVCGGADATRFGSSFFTGLLPASIGPVKPSVSLPGVGPVGALTLTPKPLPGVRVLAGSAQTGPLVISGPFGAGCVTLTAYDPTTKPFQNPSFAAPALWQSLLMAGQTLPSSVLSHVAAREENYQTGYYYGGQQQLLSDAVMRAPSLDAPGTEVIGLFLLVYLIVLVPVNYLVLKRLDRKEMAWITIPALVLVFALGTFGVGYAAKGGTVFLNRAAILETSSGQSQAGVYTELGLFSPHRTSYDITLPGANALAAIPNPGFNPYGNRNNGAETQTYGQTRFVETSDGASLQDAAVNMWAMRSFDAQSTTDLGGTVDAALRQNSGPQVPNSLTSWGITGTITNRTPYDLAECALDYNGQWQQLGTLTHGASLPVAINTPTGSNAQQPGLQIPTLLGRVDKDDPQSDVRQRMRAALADYARSLGQQNNNGYYNNSGQMPPPAAYAPASGEAILVGWSSDPALSGPAPRVDGHSVKENDVTLVVIHLPVASTGAVNAALPLLPHALTLYQSPALPFAAISRNSPVCRTALTSRNLPLLRQTQFGQPLHFRGIVRVVDQTPRTQTLIIGPAAGQPLNGRNFTVALGGPNFRRMPYLSTLQGHEVLVSGARVDGPSGTFIVLTQPSQVQLVR